MRTATTLRKARGARTLLCAMVIVFMAIVFLLPALSSAASLIDRALCDVEVLYLFEDPQQVDWPTLYYLNDKHGCDITLLTVGEGREFEHHFDEIPERGITLHRFLIDSDAPTTAGASISDSILAVLFRQRRPDVVVFGDREFDNPLANVASAIRSLPDDPSSVYHIRRIYRLASLDTPADSASRFVTVNRRELFTRYRDRMELEVPVLYSWLDVSRFSDARQVRYEVLVDRVLTRAPSPDFLSNMATNRLVPLFDTAFSDGALKNAFLNRTRNYLSLYSLARRTIGSQRIGNLIGGFKELATLWQQVRSESLLEGYTDLKPYMSALVESAQHAVLKEIGMQWDGEIILRDSPHGPKLKFRAALSVNGPTPLELSFVKFLPYWDSTEVVLDDRSLKITPHQSFVREYLVDIEREHLEAQMPESLVFVADIVYGDIPLTVTSALPIWEAPDLKISFEPDFCFVKPQEQIEVDKVVSSLNWKAVITKPLYYHGTARLNLQTPRGVFAGAYRQDWQLEKDRTTETVRISFSVSNLFELGVHEQTISLSVGGKQVAADTGRIRIASCEIDDRTTIALMPDTTGLLEEILRMAEASYWPLTDRALQTGDLEAYDVILIGPGAVRNYPSFRDVSGRIEDYVRYGGSLVILGQPRDWPEGVLPVSFVPGHETRRSADLLNRIPGAKILSRPYVISESNLLSWMEKPTDITAAVISPTEKVLVTPSGAALLSVSRVGQGQVIFCGIPLVELISELNIEAIHLLANLLNY